ncbi:MAG TPA: sigma-70 family RNA polymerase sigma factor [Polyangiaceae bacterium]|nr:sigma-70 family RNA polymerase sigma factor [Polyangiaceae bacterium]
MSGVDSLSQNSVLTEGVLEAAQAAVDAPSKAAPLDIRSLFEAHYGSVWRLLRRFGVGRCQLDDATQEVFWVAARRLPDIEPGREHAFLYGVALRIASNVVRRQKSLPPMTALGDELDLAHQAASPEQELEHRRARELLDAVLDRLPLELRTVFVLFELEGLAIKEIAELEEIPVGTASSRLRRAREEFSAIAKRVRALLLGRGESL